MSFVVRARQDAGSAEIDAAGVITRDTPEAFSRAIAGAKYTTATVQLDSRGGDLEAGIELGRRIRAAGFATRVGAWRSRAPDQRPFDEARCESSCVYAFFGGVAREILPHPNEGPQQRLGFHQFRTNLGAGFGPARSLDSLSVSAAQAFSSKLGEYIAEMGLAPSVLRLADAAPLAMHGDDPISYPEIGILWKTGVLTDDRMPSMRLVAGDHTVSLMSFSAGQYGVFRQLSALCVSRSNTPSLTFQYTVAMRRAGNPDSITYWNPEDVLATESSASTVDRHDSFTSFTLRADDRPLGRTTLVARGALADAQGRRVVHQTTQSVIVEQAHSAKLSSAKSIRFFGYVVGPFSPGMVAMEVPIDDAFRRNLKAVQRTCAPAPPKQARSYLVPYIPPKR